MTTLRRSSNCRAELQLCQKAALKSCPTLAVAVARRIRRRLRIAAGAAGRADAASALIDRHHRHAQGRSAGRLRQHHRADTQLRSARPRGRAGARRHEPRADHPAVARLALHRALSRRARRARQHLAAARQGRPDAGRGAVGPGLRDGGVRLDVRAVGAVGTGPRIRPLRRPLRHRRSARDAVARHRATPRRRHHRARRAVARRPHGRAPGRSAPPCGFISTIHTTPTSRRSRSRPGSPIVPTTARSRGPTRCSDGCAPGSRRASCGTTRWSSSPPTTARRSASTTRPGTASSPTRPRCTCRS